MKAATDNAKELQKKLLLLYNKHLGLVLNDVECEFRMIMLVSNVKKNRSIRKSMIYMTLLPKTTGVWREICVIILYTV